MGRFTKNANRKIHKQYEDKLREARDAQRSGVIRSSAQLHQEAGVLLEKINKLKA